MGNSQDSRLAQFSRGRRPRILALLAFRDEMRYLPGYFANVAPHVEGVIALDDGSVDGSADFVARQPSVLELLRKPATEPHVWNDGENHRMLVEASWRYDPDWLIGVDADERLERDFRSRALREIERAEYEDHLAYSVMIRELWNRPDAYRTDGIWGSKRSARFFKARLDHDFDTRQLHCHWAPLNSRRNRGFPKADLVIYHLRMIRESDRQARQARYEWLDPGHRWQSIGYGYLTDEENLRLEELPPGRGYKPLGEVPLEEESATNILHQPGPRKPIPKLACVVLSLQNEPGLVAAVESLLAQNKPLEIVVVNSGGGDPAGTLRNAGIEVKVTNLQERLYPGAARNVGIDATRAPYVAFLAADCVAEPGWASRRLRRHRAGALAVASAVTNPNPHNSYAWASYMLLWSHRMPGVPQGGSRLYGVSYARELFDRFGKFREDLRSGEDTEFNHRLAATVEIEWAAEVRTAHRQPTSFYELIRDQYARGRRMAQALEKLTGRPCERFVARNGLWRVPSCMAWSWLASKPRDRQRLMKAWLLIPSAAAAYSLGALLSSGLSRSAGEKVGITPSPWNERYGLAHESAVAKTETKPQILEARRPERSQLHERQVEELRSGLAKEHHKAQRLRRRLRDREQRIKELETRVRRLASRAQELKQQLQSIQGSRLWKLLRRLSYLRARASTRRREEHRASGRVPMPPAGASSSRSRPTTRGAGVSGRARPSGQKFKQARQGPARKDQKVAELRARLAGRDTGSKVDGIRPENIVWIFGHQRTGSSWLASMMWALTNHAVWDEPLVGTLFGRLYHDVTDEKRKTKDFVLGGDKEVWQSSIRTFVLAGVSMRFPEVADGRYLVIKEPHGALGAPLLMEALPESRMIFLVRDPRDVVASSLDAHKKGSWGLKMPEADEDPDAFVAARAEVYLRDIEHAKQAYEAHDGRKILIRYEDLRADTLNTMRRIYSTLDMPADEAELARIVEKFSWENVPEKNKGPGKKRRKATPGGWKEDLTPHQARVVEQIAAPLLREFYAE